MNRFFTADADRYIGKKVLEYNNAESEEERLRLESFVKERTGILLYLIPQRNLYISEEDLSGFYLDVVKDMDRIIGSFAISGSSYIAYLTQICRYRCMRYIRKKEKNEQTEIALIRSDPSLYEGNVLREQSQPYSASFPARVSSMNMKEILGYIMGRKPSSIEETDTESVLASQLSQPVNRRRFLEFLLHLPKVETASFMAGVSRVLRVDSAVISRFYELRNGELSGNDEAIESAELIAARYWKMIARLRHAMTKKADTEKLKDLMRATERAAGIYRKRLDVIKYRKRGLPQGRIAEILGIPRSTVANDISKMKALLEDIGKGMD